MVDFVDKVVKKKLIAYMSCKPIQEDNVYVFMEFIEFLRSVLDCFQINFIILSYKFPTNMTKEKKINLLCQRNSQYNWNIQTT